MIFSQPNMKRIVCVLVAVFSLIGPLSAQLVTNGLLVEYRFDEGSGAVIKGYDSTGNNVPALDGANVGGYAGVWTPLGLSSINRQQVTLAKDQGIMTKAQTVMIVADVAPPNNTKQGQATLLGTHSSAYKEHGLTGDGRPAMLNSADHGWYGGVQAGINPVLRQQGPLCLTFAYGTVNGNDGQLWYGADLQKYYMGRGAPKTSGATGDYISLFYGLSFGYAGTIYYTVIYDRVLSDAEVKQNVAYISSVLAKRSGGITLGDTIPVNRPVMIFQGDSITMGAGAPYGQCWASLVARSLNGAYRDMDAGLGAIAATDVAGAGTGYVSFGLDQVDPLFGIYGSPSTNVAVIFLGANDISSSAPADKIIAALQDRVTKVKAAGAAKVALGTILPRSNGKEDVRTAVNAAINGGKITGVDVIMDFAVDPNLGQFSNTTDVTKKYYGDGVHPTALGHNIMADIAMKALAKIGVNTDVLTFSTLGANAVGAVSDGYKTYHGTKADYETTTCYGPDKMLQNEPPVDVYYSARVAHAGPVAIGLHTDAQTETGIISKTPAAYYLANNGSGAYAVGGAAGGWTNDTNTVVPADGDILRFRRSPIAYGSTLSVLSAEVSQDNGDNWTLIAHKNVEAGNLYPRLNCNDAAMTDAIVRCNGASSTPAH
jgi:lysophospholipase L1-like esterase